MIPSDWLDTLATPFTRRGAGVAIAGALKDEIAFRGHGRVHQLGPKPTTDTLFEIGGLTEIFTAILLALMARRGKLDPDQPVAALVPQLDGLPERITPARLATHTAGLPRVPSEIARRSLFNMVNPYAAFGIDELVAWGARFRPRRAPAETAFSYSVLGMALLGFVLEEINRARLDRLFKDEIFTPLELADTVYVCSDDQEARLATPHDGRGKPVATWNYNGLAGAGGLKASASDIARLIQAVLTAPSGDGELSAAIADTLEIRRRPQRVDGEGGSFGWSIRLAGTPPAFTYTHSGRTNGSQAFIAIAPQAGIGAAVLVNSGPRARDTLRPPMQELLKTFATAWAGSSQPATPEQETPQGEGEA